MTLCELTMFPTDKGISVSPYVARILEVIDASGLDYQLTPMGTIIEGSWDDVFGLITACFGVLQTDCDRISVSIKIDYRKDGGKRMRHKIERIESILGRTLST